MLHTKFQAPEPSDSEGEEFFFQRIYMVQSPNLWVWPYLGPEAAFEQTW